MNTEYAVGNIRIRFESQARRRWFVALFYSAVTVICLAWCSFTPKQSSGAWILSACMILGVMLAVVFSWIAGNMHALGDEREMHRREHAHFKAYSLFGKLVVAILIADAYFRGHNPITRFLPLSLRGGMVDWPSALFMAAGMVYLTLPRAILLWTEPDMDADQPT
jgi:hypothetical protein